MEEDCQQHSLGLGHKALCIPYIHMESRNYSLWKNLQKLFTSAFEINKILWEVKVYAGM